MPLLRGAAPHLPAGALKNLQQFGPASLAPSKCLKNPNKWLKPLIGPRIQGRFRKALMMTPGIVGSQTMPFSVTRNPTITNSAAAAGSSPFDNLSPELRTFIDTPLCLEKYLHIFNRGSRALSSPTLRVTTYNPTHELRKPKGSKNERNRELRASKIEDKMKNMDKRIEEYRNTLLARKPKPGIETQFKKAMAKTT